MSAAFVLSHLYQLQRRVQIGTARQSICLELLNNGCHSSHLTILEGCFKTWPKRTGDSPGALSYPVPEPLWTAYSRTTALQAASYAYHHAEATNGMWTGAYGDLRKELLAHCIRQLELQQNNQPQWGGL